MAAVVITVFVLLSGWHAYRSAKKSGVWSNKVFFGILLAALAFTALISIPIYFIPQSFADTHFGLVLACWLSAIAIAVSVITVYANRWWKSVLKRSGNDKTLGTVILALVLSSLAGSAQTTNSQPPGQAKAASPTDAQKLQALERACKAGVFTPGECAAKRAAVTASNADNGQGDRAVMSPVQPSEPMRADSPNAGARPDFPNASPGSNGAKAYNDPAGRFSLMIPQGWTVATKEGCYGPTKTCPANSAGVNMMRGSSWAFVAPFSVPARQPADVVRIVAGEDRSQYRNFTMLQNEPSNLNGMDAAIGTFTGTDGDGVTVSLVVVGIAGPGGQYYVASSSVAKDGSESARDQLHSMLDSLRFAGQ